jgi:hypothetical protein
VQILWDGEARIVRAAWLDTESLADDEEDESSFADEAATSALAQASEDSDPQSRLDAAGAAARTLATGGSRLRVLLPEGCRVESGRSESPDGGEAGDRSLGAEAALPGGESAAPISLVVYMPDGSTFGEASFRVVDDQGRQVRIEINPWTGQALVSRAAATPVQSSTDDVEASADGAGR